MKTVLRVNGGILHHYTILQPELGHQSSELRTYQSNSDTS